MGQGYWILVADGFSAGLVLVNPRLWTEGEDLYGQPRNWWPCEGDETDEQLVSRHPEATRAPFWKVIR